MVIVEDFPAIFAHFGKALLSCSLFLFSATMVKPKPFLPSCLGKETKVPSSFGTTNSRDRGCLKKSLDGALGLNLTLPFPSVGILVGHGLVLCRP